MKKSNLGKKLLAVVTAAVMMVGCVATVSAYTPTSADTKALDIKGIMLSGKKKTQKVTYCVIPFILNSAKLNYIILKWIIR